MKPKSKSLLEQRAKQKQRSRRADLNQLKEGVPAAKLQRDNSVFADGFFKGMTIGNLKKAVGR